MRIDEGRRKHETGCIHDAVAVRLHVRAELGDHAVVHAHVERGVHATSGVDDARTADDEAVERRVLDGEQRHDATSSSTSAATATGPWVSRS